MASQATQKKKSKLKIACQIEYYNDPNPDEPKAFEQFRLRLRRFVEQEEWTRWKTCILDSTSSATQAAILEQSTINRGSATEKGLRWRAGATDSMERTLIQSLPYLPMNVVLISHIEHEKVVIKVSTGGRHEPPAHPSQKGLAEYQDAYLRRIALPGRIGRANMLFQQYPECYRLYFGGGTTKVQTEADDEWVACTQIPAPSDCEPTYKAIWPAPEEAPPPIHCVLYGDPGSRKSTMAATFPQPLLVWFFDGLGKEAPYLRRFKGCSQEKWTGEEEQRILTLRKEVA